MCTVTFTTTVEGYCLTSSRDEAPQRSAQDLRQQYYADNGLMLLYPEDRGAHGTWIVCRSDGRSACLLNGAYAKHERSLPYRISRGQMVLDSMNYMTQEEFIQTYEFEGIEPFTFVLADRQQVQILRWDGKKLFLDPMAQRTPFILSSCTLYAPAIQDKRASVFQEFIQKNGLDSATFWDLHHQDWPNDPTQGFLMNRGNLVRTTSITQIIVTQAHTQMTFESIPSGQKYQEVLAADLRAFPHLGS